MSTYDVRVGKNGRITIPIEIRRELNLKSGDILMLEREGGRWIMRKATPDEQEQYDRDAPNKRVTT